MIPGFLGSPTGGTLNDLWHGHRSAVNVAAIIGPAMDESDGRAKRP